MSKPTTPKDVQTRKDPIEELTRIVDGMSQEEREALLQAGIVIPAGDLSKIGTGEFTWGLRCTHCNSIALFFVGDRWMLDDGSVVDEPPPLPKHRIAWTQDLSPDEIDRHEPRCQKCGVTVPLNSDDTFCRDRHRIQRVAEFIASRDRSRDPKTVRKLVKELTKETGSYEVSASYTKPDEPVSKVIERQQGEGSLQQLDALATQTGLTEAVGRGFK